MDGMKPEKDGGHEGRGNGGHPESRESVRPLGVPFRQDEDFDAEKKNPNGIYRVEEDISHVKSRRVWAGHPEV